MCNLSNFKKVLALCGACIGLYIGSGFASMQEVLQYEASYGSMFWVVIAVTAIVYLYTNLSFSINGAKNGIKRGGDIYAVYCGKIIGDFYDWFAALFCYMSFVVMLGGANSTAMQQWGLPNGVGAVILAFVAVTTVVCGLEGIVKVLSFLGPLIIVSLLAIVGYSSIFSSLGFADGASAIDSHVFAIAQIGGGNPLASGASYAGFVILWFAAFLGELGAREQLKDVKRGMFLSSLFIFGTAVLCCVALISNIDLVWDVPIPTLVLANRMNPAFGLLFAAVIFVGIYTSAVPLLWTGVKRIAVEGSSRYKLVVVLGGVIGCIIACLVPYAPLLNDLYGLNGYLGFVLMAFMLFHDVGSLVRK